MKIEKNNLVILIIVVAFAVLFLLIIYGISSNNNKNKKKEDNVIKKEEKPKKSKEELLDDPDVQTLFDVFKELDTDSDSLRLSKGSPSEDYSKERDLTNEEKLFIVFKTIPVRERITIDCDNLSYAFTVPNGFICTKRSFGINRGIVMSRYSELFGYEKEIKLNNFLTYIYDPETTNYIYFELENELIEYEMPKAILKEAYIEDGLLTIKYKLDYSQTNNNGYFKEDVILKFKKSGDHYIFVSRKQDIYD